LGLGIPCGQRSIPSVTTSQDPHSISNQVTGPVTRTFLQQEAMFCFLRFCNRRAPGTRSTRLGIDPRYRKPQLAPVIGPSLSQWPNLVHWLGVWYPFWAAAPSMRNHLTGPHSDSPCPIEIHTAASRERCAVQCVSGHGRGAPMLTTRVFGRSAPQSCQERTRTHQDCICNCVCRRSFPKWACAKRVPRHSGEAPFFRRLEDAL